MSDPGLRERVEGWVGDFLETPAARDLPSAVCEYAGEVLPVLIVGACTSACVGPDELDEGDLRAAYTRDVARLALPGSVHERVPDLCAAFLADLEVRGRLSDGRSVGLALRAARRAYLDAAGVAPQPVRRPAPKLSPNDPCPCGSGRKYKKCCA